MSSPSQPSFSGDERQSRPDLKLNPLKLHEIIYDKDCYVYSTSYRFCISQFAFAPSTTVGPTNLDFGRAVNITWNRKDRNLLPSLHHEVCEAARTWGLDRLAVLAFAWTGGRPREALELLAQGARQAGDYFPFSEYVMASIQSFVPTKWPSSNQLQEAPRKKLVLPRLAGLLKARLKPSSHFRELRSAVSVETRKGLGRRIPSRAIFMLGERQGIARR